MNYRTIVLFGGASDERLVSVASSQHIAEQIPEAALWFQSATGQVYPVSHSDLLAHQNPFTQEFVPSAKPFPTLERALDSLDTPTLFFLGLHGGDGENGTLQAILEKRQIPFTGSGSQASADAFDKRAAKEIADKAGVATAPELELRYKGTSAEQATLREWLSRHSRLVFKPVRGGSSFGLFFVSDEASLQSALKSLSDFPNTPFLIEPFLVGTEVTVGVYELFGKAQALPASEVRVKPGQAFDYAGKYLGGATEITPAEITPAQMKAVQAMAVAMHEALGCRGYSRTDLILTAQGPVFLETNTLPGLTKASFLPQQLAVAGIPFREFLLAQIEQAASSGRTIMAKA